MSAITSETVKQVEAHGSMMASSPAVQFCLMIAWVAGLATTAGWVWTGVWLIACVAYLALLAIYRRRIKQGDRGLKLGAVFLGTTLIAGAVLLQWFSGHEFGEAMAFGLYAASLCTCAVEFQTDLRRALIAAASLHVAALVMLVSSISQGHGISAAAGFVIAGLSVLICVRYSRSLLSALSHEQARNDRLSKILGLALDGAEADFIETNFVQREVRGGKRFEALIGRPVNWDTIQGSGMIHADDLATLRAKIQSLGAGDWPIEFEHRMVRDDGETLWFRHAGLVQIGPDGAPTLQAMLVTHISERKKVEIELLEATRDAQSALLKKEEILSAQLEGLELATALDAHSAACEPAANTDASVATLQHLAASLRGVLSQVAQRDVTLGAMVEALGAARRAAEAANVEKSQFIANMSHELRTPLNAVIGYAEILEEDLLADNKEREALDASRIQRAAQTLLVLINELLDLSKIEAGRVEIRPEQINGRTIYEDVVETCRHLAEKGGNVITLQIDDSVESLVADPTRLRQCLLNLVSNACKFTENGAIDIVARVVRRDDDACLVTDVIDTGRGISAEDCARLFEPFVQVDAARTRTHNGTGLGLSITRKLARLMGGDVELKSVLGEGSRFTLSIAVGSISANGETGSSKDVILVIEDDSAARDLVARAVSVLPFDVRFADSVQSGTRQIADGAPALVVLDIHLPDNSGLNLLRSLKADAQFAAIPVLVVSLDDDRAASLELGACEHLVKPVNRDVLAAAVLRYARIAPPPEARGAPRADAA